MTGNLPSWPPKDWRALAALVFSVAGAVALTVLLWLLSGMLLPEKGWTPASEGERVTTIRWVLWLSAFCILLVLTGLGFAINRRALRGRWGDKSLDWEGGDDPAQGGTNVQEASGESRGESPAPIVDDLVKRELDKRTGGAATKIEDAVDAVKRAL